MSILEIETPPTFMPFLAESARYRACYGGRGSGKSHFFAEMLIERCVIGVVFAVCIREIQKSLNQSVKKLLESKIETMNLGHLFIVQESIIKVKNGGQIIFVGMQNHTADSIKSLEGYDIAWVEEAQSLSQKSLDLLRPTIRKEGSELWFTWNPSSPLDPVDAFFLADTPPESTILVKANYSDNPWFPDVLRQEMLYDQARDIEKFNHVWLGGYMSRSDALVFKNWLIEDFERPRGTPYLFGADWGFANDPTVLVRVSVDGNTLYIDHEAYMIGCEIVNTPDLFRSIPESNYWFITADSSRPETISYMQQHGYPKIAPSKKGAGSIEDGIEFLKSYNIVVHPRCRHTIDELSNYKYKIDTKTEQILQQFDDKHNHVIDALRYAVEGIKLKERKYKPIDYSNVDKMVI